MKQLKLIFAMLVIIPSISLAQGKNLIIKENQTYELKKGNYEFETLEIRRNGTLLVLGSTKIFCKKLKSDEGSRVQYKAGADRNDDQKLLEFTAADGSQVSGILFFIGDGADGVTGPSGANGANGKNGWTGMEVKDYGLLGKHKVPVSYPPKDGKNGTSGGNGGNGEEAMDIKVYINKLSKDGYVAISANGGNGGDGGNGGNGGNGGKGRTLESGKKGGSGGRGGNGGNGGDGGKVYASLVHVDGATDEDKKRLLEFLNSNVYTLPGIPGRGGLGGNGGASGRGGKGGTLISIKKDGETYLYAGGGSEGGGNAGGIGTEGVSGDVGEAKKEILSQSEWVQKNRSFIDDVFGN